MDTRGYVLFYESFFLAGKSMSQKHRLAYYDAIFEYALTGKEPSDLFGPSLAAFIISKPNIDANMKRRNDGNLGGNNNRKPKHKNLPTGSQKNINDLPTGSHCDDPKDKDKDDLKEKEKVKVNDDDDDNVNVNSDSDVTVSTVSTVSTVPTVPTAAAAAASEIDFVFSEYARLCPSLQSAKHLSDKRTDAISLLLSQLGLDRVIQLFSIAENTPFLKGHGVNGWVASFDWLISPDNAVRVLDGAFNDFRQPDSGSFSTEEFVRAALAKSNKLEAL